MSAKACEKLATQESCNAGLLQQLALVDNKSGEWWKARVEAAESECAALRAEVADKAETIRAQNIAYDRLESRLAAANALLSEATEERDAWNERRDAHLTGQAPARTDHERAVFTTPAGQTLSTCTLADVEVLKELNSVPTARLQTAFNTDMLGGVRGIAKAELARRESSK